MTYRVEVTREGKSWLADVPGLPGAHTYAGNLVALDNYIREVIGLVEDLPEGAEADLSIEWDFSAVDNPLVSEAAELATQRRAVEDDRARIAARSRELAQAMVADDWSVRDIAGALGVSPGRVSQLVSA